MPDVEEFELHYSRPVAVFVGVLALISAARIGVFALALMHFGVGAVFAIAMLAIVGPIYFVLFRYVTRALLGRDAVVRLDAHGITDTRQRVAFVPWNAVQRVRLGSGDKAHFLCVEIKAADVANYTRAPGIWRVLLRWLETLGDWNVNLMTLRCTRSEVAAIAETLRKAAIRRRVEQMNRPAPVHPVSHQ